MSWVHCYLITLKHLVEKFDLYKKDTLEKNFDRKGALRENY